MRTSCGTILALAVCGSPCEAMMRGARESGGFYGVTMLSDGKRARKSSAFRVIRPSLACARAPIMTSATGRRATLPDRLRWTCLFHAETAMERSSSLLTAVLPREVLPSTLRWCAASEKSMHIQALPLHLYAAASAQSLLCRCKDSVLCSRGGSSLESFAYTRGFGRVSKPVHVRSLLSPMFSCRV